MVKAEAYFGKEVLDELILWYAHNGCMHKDDRCFALAVEGDREFILGNKEEPEVRDCWYVHWVEGDDLTFLFDLIPKLHKWIIFNRKDVDGLRCLSYFKMLKRIKKGI